MTHRPARRTFLAGTAASFATIGFIRAPACAAQFNFKSGGNYAEDHPVTIRVKRMWAAVERESGGRLRTEHFPNSELGTDTAMLTQLRSGALQFQMIAPGLIQNVAPAAGIFDVGFVFESEEQALHVADGPLGDHVRKEIVAQGMHVLRTIWNSGMRHVTANPHPIRLVDDLGHFKIRTPPGKLYVDLWKTLGAGPTPINFSELYTALETKVVDGQETPLITIATSKLYEVQKYLSLTGHGWASNLTLANPDAWNSLPPDLQEIVERNNTKYARLERTDSIRLNASIMRQLAARGMVVNAVERAPFRARLKPYYREWAAVFGSTEWGLLEGAIGTKLA